MPHRLGTTPFARALGPKRNAPALHQPRKASKENPYLVQFNPKCARLGQNCQGARFRRSAATQMITTYLSTPLGFSRNPLAHFPVGETIHPAFPLGNPPQRSRFEDHQSARL